MLAALTAVFDRLDLLDKAYAYNYLEWRRLGSHPETKPVYEGTHSADFVQRVIGKAVHKIVEEEENERR